MFRFHDKTRRRICQAAFVLLCIVPTAGVLGWCAWRHRPGHVEAEARRLGSELGLAVSLDAVQYVRPGTTLYEGLELADPETGQLVVRFRALEAARTEVADQQGQSRPVLVLTASQPEIETAAIGQLGGLLKRLLQRRAGRAEDHVELNAAELTLRTDGQSQTLTELHGSLWELAAGTQIHISFRLAVLPGEEARVPGVAGDGPARLGIIRNRQTTPATTALELDTGGATIPCSMLAWWLPGMAELGPRSRFRGYLWASEVFDGQAPAGWDAYVTGQLIDVDLGGLVSSRFPHQLTGTGTVSIQSARIRRGRLEEAEGELHVGPGMIGRSLIAAAVERLHLIEGAEPATLGDPVPYEQLALAVVLDGQGIQLHGRCRASGLDAILVDRRRRLLSKPVFQPQPVVALLQTLVPINALQVPATRQTEWLMRHLPVAEIIPPGAAGPALPHGGVSRSQ